MFFIKCLARLSASYCFYLFMLIWIDYTEYCKDYSAVQCHFSSIHSPRSLISLCIFISLYLSIHLYWSWPGRVWSWRLRLRLLCLWASCSSSLVSLPISFRFFSDALCIKIWSWPFKSTGMRVKVGGDIWLVLCGYLEIFFLLLNSTL